MLFLFCFLQGCEKTDYYYTVENEKKVTGVLLYSDDQMTVFFTVYNGLVSRLSISSKSDNMKTELIKYDHYLLVGEQRNIPAIVANQGLGEIQFNQNRSATVISKFSFEENPESLVEAIDVDILVGDNLIAINKKFLLKKDSFSRFDALMNM